MKARLVAPLLIAAIVACAAPRPSAPPPPELLRGFNVEPYAGVCAEYRTVSALQADIEGAISRAEETVRRRLALSGDSARVRVLRLADDTEDIHLETRVSEGFSTQVVSLPAPAIARGHRDAETMVLEAVCRAFVTDPIHGDLPLWLRRGAPLWLSGRFENRLHEALLVAPSLPVPPDRAVPPLEFDFVGDELTSALFLRFLAVEFGADRIPLLVTALGAGHASDSAFREVLGTDPSSLPLAFESFRLREIDRVTDGPLVREFGALLNLPPGDRVTRLSGLAERASDEHLAALLLSELGLAQFEHGDFAAAADTLARAEREFPRLALNPDRDRFFFALSFARDGDPRAAALRLATFLAEFPRSSYRPAARFELGATRLAVGRADDAMEEYRRLVEEAPRSIFARRAALVLAAYHRARSRFDLAAQYLDVAGDLPAAEKERAALQAEMAGELGDPARRLVDAAISDILSREPERVAAGRRTLNEVGAPAADLVSAEMQRSDDPALILEFLPLALAWPADTALESLTPLLAHPDDGLAAELIETLRAVGLTPPEIRARIAAVGPAAAAAARAFEARYGSAAPDAGLAALMASDRWEDRVAAAERLADSGGPEGTPALAELARDPSPQVRVAVVRALRQGAVPRLTSPDFATLLEDPSILVRVAVVENLGAWGELAWLRGRALGDPAGRVRYAAGLALLASGEARDDVAVLGLLADPDPAVSSELEARLRADRPDRLARPLADALTATDQSGVAMRIVRILAAYAGSDFGYDPALEAAEQKRVAAEFLEWLRNR